jgi:hypothetical protein
MCLQVRDLTSLQYMMDNLRDCRENESKHSTQIRKLIASFDLLTRYLPEGVMSADELDCTNVLETTYKKLSDHCEDASQDVANMQAGFKKGLLKDVVDFQGDMKRFRDEWLTKVCERGCYFFWGGVVHFLVALLYIREAPLSFSLSASLSLSPEAALHASVAVLNFLTIAFSRAVFTRSHIF